jgi:hypothetical protein
VERKLSFWNFGVWGFGSPEGERSGHSRGENPKLEVTTEDYRHFGNRDFDIPVDKNSGSSHENSRSCEA